jgi:putative hemolysin
MSDANTASPQWGHESGVAPWLVRWVARLSGIDSLHHIYKSIGPTQGPVEFASRALSTMHIDVDPCEQTLMRVPLEGRVIIVANHPFGALDGLAAIRIIGARRPDVRVLANADLTSITELAPLILPLANYSTRGSTPRNAQSLRKAWRWLEQEHALVIFPAGEVAHFDARARCVTDPPWSPIVGRLVQKTAAPVVPLFFSGQNSALFQIAGMVSPQLRTLLLPGELRRRMRSRVNAHLGEAIPNQRIREFKSPEALALHLRLKTFLAPAVNEARRAAATPAAPRTLEPIATEMPADCIADEIARLAPESRLLGHAGMEVLLARADAIPRTLAEIGRLREVTFRGVGEGTGRARDLDRFDAHYEHLFIWHAANRQIVGAYRLGRTDEIRRRHGRSGLYTTTLFNYRDPFFMLLGPALELGRSFVRAEYQRSFAPLMLLWKGIAEFVARNPRYARLIGPVSVSGDYLDTSKHLLVDFLRGQRFDHLLGGMVGARNPFPRSHAMRSLASELAMLGTIEPLAALVEDLEPDGKGVPILLRQYLKLGGRVLGFNVDQDFGNSIDCLLLVDLRETEPRELRKYMRADAAARLTRKKGGQPPFPSKRGQPSTDRPLTEA